MEVRDVIAPVQGELKEFDRYFKDAIKSDIGLVDTVVRYIVKRKGKRIRPALVLLSAGACGGIVDASYRGAALVELLHTATLVHDDVVDEAPTRRGMASINAVWKNKVAVLMGDFILARGLLLSLDNGDVDMLNITSRAVQRMSEGEILQIQRARRLKNDEETYFRIIRDKTASLLSACCEIGAVSATEDPEVRANLRDYGEHLGIAFQIQDDVLDYAGIESNTGKPIGGDAKEKKMTLPLIYAFGAAPSGESKRIMRLLKKGVDGENLKEVVAFVHEHGGIENAQKKAKEYQQLALSNIAALPDSDYKRSLTGFTDFVINRSK
ncbi:MAG: polyprenyl synthetase [Ectothiorhodospiraceae bacterium]|nr:polyprenyl synthetase [Ectothiorhodospiraceae bacterium]